MKTKILIAGCLLSQLLSAQTEIRKTLPDFNQLLASVNTTIYLQKADAPYIIVDQKDSGYAPKVEKGILLLLSNKNHPAPEKITIGYVNINVIIAKEASVIKSKEVFKTDKLQLSLGGASKCKMEFEADTILCVLNGAASASFSGTCNKLNAAVSGASSFKA